MKEASKHIYLHVPFCDGKCVYCGFYSEIFNVAAADRFIKAVGSEFDLMFAGIKPSPETIYFGGGTPSILSEEQLSLLCSIVLKRVSASALKEWTVEANPGTLSVSKLHMLKEAGVSRVSIGVQSFDDDVLKNIGRRHSAEDIISTVKAVRAAGIKKVGLDLIASLPGVDLQAWRRTLQNAVELQPDHLSVYALSVEDGSRMEKLVRTGNIVIPSDESMLESLDIAEAMLGKAGFERYEISNFARPGSECLHNLSFWRGEDYIGLGPAASSRDGCHRRTNKADTAQYISALSSGRKPPCDEESLTFDSDVMERLVFAFRLTDGVDLQIFGATYGAAGNVDKWKEVLKRLAVNGLTECRNGFWKLTSQGRNMADSVAVELMAGH